MFVSLKCGPIAEKKNTLLAVTFYPSSTAKKTTKKTPLQKKKRTKKENSISMAYLQNPGRDMFDFLLLLFFLFFFLSCSDNLTFYSGIIYYVANYVAKITLLISCSDNLMFCSYKISMLFG